MRTTPWLVVVSFLSCFAACGGDDAPTSTIGDGASGTTSLAGSGGSGGSAGEGQGGSGGSSAGQGGSATAGQGGAGSGQGGQAGEQAAGAGGGGGAGGAGQGGSGGEPVGGGTGVSGQSQGGGGQGGSEPDPTPVCNPALPVNPNPAVDTKILPPNEFGALKEQRSLAAMSADGLTVVWTSQQGIFYGDRKSAGEAVGEYKQLPGSLSASGYPSLDKAALSGDGKRMVLVSEDKKRFAQLKRLDLGDPFDPVPDEASFQSINAAVAADELIGDPVLVSDDKTLYFARYKGDTEGQIMVATRDSADAPWGLKGPLADPALDTGGAARKRLWWVSPDQLTFYFYDPASKKSRAGWRKNVGKPIDEFRTLGEGIQTPTSTSPCIELYYTAPNDEGYLDVFRIGSI